MAQPCFKGGITMLDSWSEIETDRLVPHPTPFPKSRRSHPLRNRHSQITSHLLLAKTQPLSLPISRFRIEPRKALEYHFVLKEMKSFLDKVFSEPSIPDQSVETAIPQIESFLKMHFRKRRTVYPSDVARALGIDYEVVR